jgi:hypothetical protein
VTVDDSCRGVREMVLADLGGRIAERLQQLRPRRILRLDPLRSPGSLTVVRPVRSGSWPVINAARPAVRLACA